MSDMTTMLLCDGAPVAIVGATRWYAAPCFHDLDAAHQASVTAIAQLLIAYWKPPGAPTRFEDPGPAG